MDNKEKLKLSQSVALAAGIFCTVVAMLLLLNFWQLSKSSPIESKVLESLVEKLQDDPNNDALKVEIRNFDLLARKAYFNAQWQIETGAYLLLAGCVVFILALRVYHSAKHKIEPPSPEKEDDLHARLWAQRGVVIVGSVLFALAFLASFSSVNYLNRYDELANHVAMAPQNEAIPIIEVVDVPESDSSDVISEMEEEQQAQDNTPVNDTLEEKVKAEQPVEKQFPQKPVTSLEKEKTLDTGKKEKKTTRKEEKSGGSLSLEELKRQHNSFRGPLGQGVAFHKNIPVQWDGASGTNVLWKVKVPKQGFNSPVVWDNRVFVAGADEAAREVYCFDAQTGKLLWTGVADNIPGSPAKPPRVTEDTGLSAPTLSTDGNAVFAIFATGDVVAFNYEGKRLWARNLGVPDNHYGHSSSLITWAGKLIIQYDTNKGAKVLALDNATGETLWETKRDAKISWASPVLIQMDGKMQVVLTADPIVAGYDIETGEELWKVDCMMGEVGPSVAFDDGVVFAANEYARLVAIDPKKASILWENDEYLPEASSPLAYNGLLFVATSYGVLACYDAKSGEKYWEHDVGTTLYSSPMTADGKLFMMDNDGVMRVYEFGKEMKLLSENSLGESAGTTPAFMDGKIFIRGEQHLYCIGK